MGKLAHVVGDMPFAGRAAVENAYFWARSETSDLSSKFKKCAAATGFLTVFALIHGVQAKMGMVDFTHDITEARQGGGVSSYVESTISGLYILAMSAVTYTQLQLAGKTVVDTIDVAVNTVQDKEIAPRRVFEVQSPQLNEILFTLAGQMIFLAQNDGRR